MQYNPIEWIIIFFQFLLAGSFSLVNWIYHFFTETSSHFQRRLFFQKKPQKTLFYRNSAVSIYKFTKWFFITLRPRRKMATTARIAVFKRFDRVLSCAAPIEDKKNSTIVFYSFSIVFSIKIIQSINTFKKWWFNEYLDWYDFSSVW